LFLIWVAITFCCEGGHFTLVPAICSKLFGAEGARVFGFAYSFAGLAALL
jgi:hypothetical protein